MRLPVREKIAASALLAISAALWMVILVVVGAAVYGTWVAIRSSEPGAIIGIPIVALSLVFERLPSVPGYIWLAVLGYVYLEWRLGRIDPKLLRLSRRFRRRRTRRVPARDRSIPTNSPSSSST